MSALNDVSRSAVDQIDGQTLEDELNHRGNIVIEQLIPRGQCAELAALYDQSAHFRNRVIMARHNCGRGKYQYFDYPLPDLIAQLRRRLYARLAPIANRWYERMRFETRFPDDHPISLSDGAMILRGLAGPRAGALADALNRVTRAAPFRHMITPGGRAMQVAMSNCGRLGWTTARHGYRYTTDDPTTGYRWPAMPACFSRLAKYAAFAAGYPAFVAVNLTDDPNWLSDSKCRSAHGCFWPMADTVRGFKGWLSVLFCNDSVAAKPLAICGSDAY